MRLTGLVVNRKERENDKGPLVYRYKAVSTVDERVAPPILGKVRVSDKFRAVQRSPDGCLDFVGRLLEHVLDCSF